VGDVRPGSDARRPLIDGLFLLVPSSWWVIDLVDEPARRRSIAALVEEQLGRTDERAALRADLRTQLTSATEQAVAAGGVLMAISLMQVEGVPVPATLTVYRVPGLRLDDAGLAALLQVLGEDEPDAVVAADGVRGPVVRRVTRRPGPAILGGEDVTLMIVDYWLDSGDGGPVVNLTFSSPMLVVGAALLDLFDTVAASVGPAEDPDEAS